MLSNIGQVGRPQKLIGDIVAPSFTPASLSPLLLLDGGTDATANLWKNSSLKWPSAYQDVSSNQPVINAGTVEFDGADDYMIGGYYNYGAKVAQTLPDGAGSDVGKGITCTGLAIDDVTDTFWVSNHGQAGGGDPYTPSLMNVSKDGSTMVSELVFTAQFPSAQSIQGVTVDTSDSTLWFISKAENLIRHVSKTGTDLGSITVDSGANGLAYDSGDDTLLVLYDNKQLKRYNAATGALIETVVTFTTLSDVDHLHLDEMNNVLWVSYGASGSTAQVSAYSIDDDILSDPIRLPDSTAIEGIYLDDSTLYIADDGYFHNDTLNQLHSYTFNSAGVISTITSAYSTMEFNMTVKIGATSSSAEAIYAIGDPLSGRGFAVFLVGNSNNTLRVIINDGSAPLDTVDLTCSAALTSYSVLTLKANFSARTISLYQNGVLQGQGTYNSGIDASVFYNAFSIAGLPDGTRAVHVDFKNICITDYLLSETQNNNLGNYLATQHGLSWTDM